jgi:hypothetical protein
MKEPDHKPDEQLDHLLKQSLPPTGTRPQAALDRDLWPAMLHRMERQSFAIPWFDWALLAALAVCLTAFPRAIPVLLYHL